MAYMYIKLGSILDYLGDEENNLLGLDLKISNLELIGVCDIAYEEDETLAKIAYEKQATFALK